MAELSEVTGPDFLEGLAGWELVQVRTRRDAVNELQTGLSYLRRIVQGRLDIVVAAQEHRRQGDASSVATLVEELPSILSENVHAPGLGRLPTLMAPGRLDPEMERRLEEILPPERLAALDTMPEDELASTVTALSEFERTVSDRRRAVLDVLDRLEEEIVRRYRDGEASVDSLLGQ